MIKKRNAKGMLSAFLALALALGGAAAVSNEMGGRDLAGSKVQASSGTAAGKVVYLDAAQDGVGGDGSSAASAVKTLEEAYQALNGGDGTIVVCGDLTVATCGDGMTSPFCGTSGNVSFTGKDPGTGVIYDAKITVTDSNTVKDKDYIPFFTSTSFEYVTFDAVTNYSLQFVTGPSLTFGEGMVFLRNGAVITDTYSDLIVVRMGSASEVITAKYYQCSGTLSAVYGGNDWMKVGNTENTQGSEITITGSAAVLARLECGANKKYVSRTDLTVGGNARVGALNFSGYNNGNLKTVNVWISGGTIETIWSQRTENKKKTNTIETLNVTVSGDPVFGYIDLSEAKITTANLVFSKELETDLVFPALDSKWTSIALGEDVKLQLTGEAPIPAPSKVTMANGSILYLHGASEPEGIVKNGSAKVVTVDHTGHSLSRKEASCSSASFVGNIEYWCCADAACPSYGLRYLDEAGAEPVSAAATELKNGHSLCFVKAVKENCTRAGVVEHYHCELCGKNFADEAGAMELTEVAIRQESHQMTKVEAKAPTCTQDGVRYTHWHCSKCNWNYKDEAGTEVFSFSVVEPKTGHGDSLKKVEAEAASCTKDGVIAHWACELCGKLYTDALYDYSRLELTAEKVVDKSYHALKRSEAVAPTKEANGSIEYWYCDVEGCENYGKLFADEKGQTEITDKASVVIPKLEQGNEPSGAKTGDTTSVMAALLLLLLGMAGVMALVWSKKHNIRQDRP